MTDDVILSIRNVSKSFNDEQVLKDVNLDLHSGEIHIIMGENGSGKSLLMKIITGLFTVDSGEILFRGNPINHLSVNKAMHGGIYYQHQDLPVFENLSVAENIFFDYHVGEKKFFKVWNSMESVAMCRTLFDELGIDFSPTKRIGQFGFAERQLIFAAKAYISDARLIIFDEPTAGMSEVDREKFFSILFQIKKRADAIFYISHRMEEITKIGDRLSVMDQGRIVITLNIRNIDQKDLIKLITGENHHCLYPKIPLKKSNECVLNVVNLSSDKILKEINFMLYKQEILGITGLMGSGRTRLANCLFGINKIDSGRMILNNKGCKFRHPADALKAGISLIPEDREVNGMFYPHNISQNMTLASIRRFLYNKVIDEDILQRVVKDYSLKMGISDADPTDVISSFSGGNQQKVLIARWFMQRSQIYIMDEPTRGIDIASKIDIYNAMNNLVINGASVILLSSDIEEILGMCDRILVLADGKIVAELPQKEATKEKIYSLATNEG